MKKVVLGVLIVFGFNVWSFGAEMATINKNTAICLKESDAFKGYTAVTLGLTDVVRDMINNDICYLITKNDNAKFVILKRKKANMSGKNGGDIYLFKIKVVEMNNKKANAVAWVANIKNEL